MNKLQRFRWFLWWFGRYQVRMIGYVRPKLIALDDERIVVRIDLNRRSQNHVKSMYFGALAVGADLAGGFHGFYHADKIGVKVPLLFKSFKAQFLKRAESEVYFVSSMGETVAGMITTSMETNERQNENIEVVAYSDYPNCQDVVAIFSLELSIKVSAR